MNGAARLGAPARRGHAMRDDPSVIALVAREGDGDQEAWNELVERYARWCGPSASATG